MCQCLSYVWLQDVCLSIWSTSDCNMIDWRVSYYAPWVKTFIWGWTFDTMIDWQLTDTSHLGKKILWDLGCTNIRKQIWSRIHQSSKTNLLPYEQYIPGKLTLPKIFCITAQSFLLQTSRWNWPSFSLPSSALHWLPSLQWGLQRGMLKG